MTGKENIICSIPVSVLKKAMVYVRACKADILFFCFGESGGVILCGSDKMMVKAEVSTDPLRPNTFGIPLDTLQILLKKRKSDELFNICYDEKYMVSFGEEQTFLEIMPALTYDAIKVGKTEIQCFVDLSELLCILESLKKIPYPKNTVRYDFDCSCFKVLGEGKSGSIFQCESVNGVQLLTVYLAILSREQTKNVPEVPMFFLKQDMLEQLERILRAWYKKKEKESVCIEFCDLEEKSLSGDKVKLPKYIRVKGKGLEVTVKTVENVYYPNTDKILNMEKDLKCSLPVSNYDLIPCLNRIVESYDIHSKEELPGHYPVTLSLGCGERGNIESDFFFQFEGKFTSGKVSILVPSTFKQKSVSETYTKYKKRFNALKLLQCVEAVHAACNVSSCCIMFDSDKNMIFLTSAFMGTRTHKAIIVSLVEDETSEEEPTTKEGN